MQILFLLYKFGFVAVVVVVKSSYLSYVTSNYKRELRRSPYKRRWSAAVPATKYWTLAGSEKGSERGIAIGRVSTQWGWKGGLV